MDTIKLKYWDQCKTPPDAVLKPIEAGRLKGKTDIKPQWRMLVMTEMFGPVGQGWWYVIKSQRELPVDDGQIALFIEIDLFVKYGEKTSQAIPSIGCALLVEKESRGLYLNKNACKSALTDALGAAMKAIGVAADVYMGEHQKKMDELDAGWQKFLATILSYRDCLGRNVYDSIVAAYQPLESIKADPSKQTLLHQTLHSTYENSNVPN